MKQIKTITVEYGIYKAGKKVLILKTIPNFPDDINAIQLLNAIVGKMEQGCSNALMDGHYFAWDYVN